MIDRDKLYTALGHLSDEDPTFNVRSDEETGQTIISGMGELHLDIIVDRLFREFKVEANTGKPEVSYREYISQNSDANAKFVRQSGGRGQYGHVVIELTTKERGHGVTVESKVVGGNIPKEYIKPAIAGIKEAAATGVVAGYPVIDFHVDIIDGSFHAVDSSEMAFKIAGSPPVPTISIAFLSLQDIVDAHSRIIFAQPAISLAFSPFILNAVNHAENLISDTLPVIISFIESSASLNDKSSLSNNFFSEFSIAPIIFSFFI